jgi:hypothetical protein
VLDYATYHLPLRDALADGAYARALHTFAGLHPPLYSLLFNAVDTVWPAPLAWLLLSALASSLAAYWTARAAALEAGPTAATIAAAWMAVAPVQLAYAAEVNDYPLATATIAALLYAAARHRRSTTHWPALVAAGTAAAWTHALGGIAALAAMLAAARDPAVRTGLRRIALPLTAFTLLCAPLLASVVRLAGEPHTFHQPALAAGARLELLWSRFGPSAGFTAAMVLPGLASFRRPPAWPAAPVLLATLGALVLFQALGIAAPHQFPYLTLLGPPAALLAAAAMHDGRRRLVALLLLGFLALAAALRQQQALAVVWRDQAAARAIDVAQAASRPGDALWLITPYHPDDDKSQVSPVLWRFRPWEPMPAARPLPFDRLDFRYGTPRWWRGRTLSLFTRIFPGPMLELLAHHAARGETVYITLYDAPAETHLAEELERLLGPRAAARARRVGNDTLYVVEPGS